jgi:DDE superfamily endonuclease
MQTLLARHYPHAASIRLVQDNLNTHTPGAFYEVLPPAQAFALAQQFESHYTPKKGSWLNVAEIEFAARSKQCLARRIPDLPSLRREFDFCHIQPRALLGGGVQLEPPGQGESLSRGQDLIERARRVRIKIILHQPDGLRLGIVAGKQCLQEFGIVPRGAAFADLNIAKPSMRFKSQEHTTRAILWYS